jgi:hypothetical protein
MYNKLESLGAMVIAHHRLPDEGALSDFATRRKW